MSDSFSKRHGFRPGEAEITIREGAPSEIRGAILQMVRHEIGLSPDQVRNVLCGVLRITPNPSNWSTENVWGECTTLIEECPWNRVYDFVEALYAQLSYPLVISGDDTHAERWQESINEYFREEGVGWRMVDGLLETRSPEFYETAVDTACKALESGGMPTARREIEEALRDLSRRPEPDLTGAISHAIAALECVAREVTGDANSTLGKLLSDHLDLFPPPINQALEKLWGYTSETARHVREGNAPERQEAELTVGLSAVCASYLGSTGFTAGGNGTP